MYIYTNRYGHREYIRFQFGPKNDVYYKHWTTWKTQFGYAAEVVYYNHWSMSSIARHSIKHWSFTRRGVRNKVARTLRRWRKADRRYTESREEG
jgi:hypothetical protein